MPVELEGMAELQNKLSALGQKGRRVENKAVRSGGEVLLKRMQDEVPRSAKDHMHIRDDLKVSGISRATGVPVVKVSPSKETAWRAKFLEYGTVKMPPNPFMSRAADESQHEVAAVMKSAVKLGLKL